MENRTKLEEGSVNEETTAVFLAGVEMFSAFQADELESLASQAESKWYEFGDPVCDAGDACE